MASSDNKKRFKKVADKLGRKVTDLLGEEDVYEEELLFALEDLNLCNGEEFLEATPEQLRELKLSDEVVGGLREAQNRYRSFYQITGEKGVKPPHSSKDCLDTDRPGSSHGESQKLPPKVRNEIILNDLPSHRYNIDKNRHGLIIINENFKYLNKRTVAASEKKHLEQMFSDLTIKPKIHENLNGQDIEKEVTNFVKDFATAKPSLIFIAICSHGGKLDEISGINAMGSSSKEKYDFTTLNQIERILYTQESLIGIPKVFLIQACFGGKVDVETDHFPAKFTIPKMATSTSDTVIVFNTGSDDYSCEKEHDYFKMLRENVGAYKNEHHLIDILTINAAKFSTNPYGKHLSSTTQSTLQKFLYI